MRRYRQAGLHLKINDDGTVRATTLVFNRHGGVRRMHGTVAESKDAREAAQQSLDLFAAATIPEESQ